MVTANLIKKKGLQEEKPHHRVGGSTIIYKNYTKVKTKITKRTMTELGLFFSIIHQKDVHYQMYHYHPLYVFTSYVINQVSGYGLWILVGWDLI